MLESKKSQELRKEYLEYLDKLKPDEIIYSKNYFLWTKKYSVKDMMYEMENKTEFSNQILLNIYKNRVGDIPDDIF